jgi:hypothetical protein
VDRLIVVPDDQVIALKKEKISNADIIQALNTGDVYFSESVKDKATKVYKVAIELEDKGEKIIYFTLPRESFICEVHVKERNAKSVVNTSKGKGKIIHFPKDNNIVFVDTNARVKCQQMALGFKEAEKILERMKRSGTIDFEKSNLSAQPKAEHFIQFKSENGEFIGFKAIWYKSKITISQFESQKLLNCP